ncbi:YjbH domain-containing protein [Halomonas korlensis]|uniref:Exopolysaccharide biosynthesis protein YbjH n=1 Tax=Halomonas korlensis TaxID=463301 RepID=A0A1I7KD71_9GAMM|nr:YjbH domain-containing protein [Halomonas korlensis]SFU95367.1 Exopolysaccharide biosynthesis protein YbjH [Halomonas korlensis]
MARQLIMFYRSSVAKTRVFTLPIVMMTTMALPVQSGAQSGGLGSGQSDFGGVGLMQTPTARMAPVGTLSASFSRTAPYRRYNVFLQPTEWLEGGFRYVEVENRRFGEAIAGDRRMLDKGFDVKLRLLEETRYWPELAVGFRDVGGTTLFGAEYLVANKRWGDFDVSLGLGWGYLGNAGDIGSPLGWLAERFDERPDRAGGDFGGEFAVDQLFSGPMAFFGGVEYQTPWDPLVLQFEVEGNDYANEPQANNQAQDTRVNLGARLALTENLSLHGGWQRGDTAMGGISYNVDLAGLRQVKNDPEPLPIGAQSYEDWQAASEALNDNAGVRVNRITRRGNDLRVEAEPVRFRSLAQSEGRAGRILHAQADDDIDTFRFEWQERGLALRESVHDRAALVAAAGSAEQEYAHRYGVYAHANLDGPEGEVLHEAPPQRLSWGLGPRLDQNFGGPDGYLYRLMVAANAEYRTDANGWFSGEVTWTALDNLDNYDYIANSELPRVRTFIGDYLSESPVGIEHLQYTRTGNLSDNVYAMGYGGLLEMMYAGVGGEVLYRSFDSPVAFGADVNWVKQRDFDQGVGLRDYDTWTGHFNAYVETGIEDVLAKVSVGKYLAGDVGGTLDLSREFDSGVRMGAWGTWTDAGDDFGEGGFDKGLYLSIPFDAFFTRSSRERANIAWRPLTRDGGARLGRRYTLYDITHERDMGRYWEDYDKSWE